MSFGGGPIQPTKPVFLSVFLNALIAGHVGNELQNLRVRFYLCAQYRTWSPGPWTPLGSVHASLSSTTIVVNVVLFALTFEVGCLFLCP